MNYKYITPEMYGYGRQRGEFTAASDTSAKTQVFQKLAIKLTTAKRYRSMADRVEKVKEIIGYNLMLTNESTGQEYTWSLAYGWETMEEVWEKAEAKKRDKQAAIERGYRIRDGVKLPPEPLKLEPVINSKGNKPAGSSGFAVLYGVENGQAKISDGSVIGRFWPAVWDSGRRSWVITGEGVQYKSGNVEETFPVGNPKKREKPLKHTLELHREYIALEDKPIANMTNRELQVVRTETPSFSELQSVENELRRRGAISETVFESIGRMTGGKIIGDNPIYDIPAARYKLSKLAKSDESKVWSLLLREEGIARRSGRLQGERGFSESQINAAIDAVMGQKRDRSSFDAVLRTAKEIASRDERVARILMALEGEQGMLRSIQAKRGLYGVKWAEKNTRSLATAKKAEIRKLKERLVSAIKLSSHRPFMT